MERTICRIALLLALLTALAPLALAQKVPACTVSFDRSRADVFAGPWIDASSVPTTWPLELGNVRITNMLLPPAGRKGGQGLWLLWRGAVDQSLINSDADWDGERGLTFVCEAIDPRQPIGLRLVAQCDDWSAHYGNLSLAVGPDVQSAREVVGGRRFGNGPHHWQVQTSISEIYGGDTDRDQFVVTIRAEGRGAFLIRQMQLFRYRVQ